MDTLVLGLGNDLCGDDGVGIAAANRLKTEVSHFVDIATSSESGLALLDYLLGYSRVIIIDAIQTSQNEPGTVTELTLDDLRQVINPSPHYTGLPEMQKLSQELHFDFPSEIKIFAIEISEKYEINESLSQQVSAAIDNVLSKIKSLLVDWRFDDKSKIPIPNISLSND